MNQTPIDFNIVKQKIAESKLPSIGKASIREIKKLINQIEVATGENFIRMEMGIPGIPASKFGVDAQIEALKNGVAALYPDIEGIPELKEEASKFCKNFINIDVRPSSIIPTVGSMMGGFAAFMLLSKANKQKDTTLFIDPGFPVQKQQHRALNLKFETFDVYDYRGDKLREKLESYLSQGNINSILYSNPNNPSWICFTEEELQIIGELATKYDVVVIEDLAYFGMDFRHDISTPGVAPYQASVANYTDKYILFISSSKAFSYAGERIGLMVISDTLFDCDYPDLQSQFGNANFGKAMIFGCVYCLSSGTSHSAQFALAAILKACNNGLYNYIDDVKVYGEKATIMKKIFLENGFTIVYDADGSEPLADGFYFTVAYPGMSGEELIEAFLYYGISAISLAITGSKRTEGIRACVSLVNEKQFPDLEYRLRKFNENHKK